MSKCQADLVAFDFHRLINRPAERDFLSVAIRGGLRDRRSPTAFFVPRVDIARFSDINDEHSLSGIRQFERQRLGFSEASASGLSSGAAVFRFEVGELYWQK